MKKQFIHSSKLLESYKKGQLDIVTKQFGGQLNEHTFLGAGDDASTFLYNENEVFKICTKKCRFLEKNKEGDEFKKQINNFSPYFLPIKDILYEDKYIMIYTQDLCKKIKKEQIEKKDILFIFEMVRLMFQKNYIITDIGPHNIGIFDGRPVLFDYHSLQSIHENGKINEDVNINRIARNLTLYMTYIFDVNKGKEYKQLMKCDKQKFVKIIEKEDLLPNCLMILLRYLTENKNIKPKKIIKLIDECIIYLNSIV